MAKPFDDRDGTIWYDGKMVPWRDSTCHILTHSLHYGGAVFEGERAYGGKIFKSVQHSERLHDSAKMVGYDIPYSVEEIEAAKEAVLKENNLSDAYIRVVAWRGSEQMGLGATGTKVHMAVAAWEWPPYFASESLRFCIADWRRPAPDTAPSHAKVSGLYMICTMAKHDAVAKGYDDALMLDYRGRIAECTAANIFFVMDGELHTPDPDCFLDGITRQTLIELAEKRGIKVVVRPILPEELGKATEVFVTGTAAEVMPVSHIAGHEYTPGEITKTLIDDYFTLVGKK